MLGGFTEARVIHSTPGQVPPQHPAGELQLQPTPQTSELFTPQSSAPACQALPRTTAVGLRAHPQPRLLLPWQLARPSPLTYPVSLQVPLHLPRRRAGPQAPHHHQEVSGFNLPPLLLVVQGEAFLVLCQSPEGRIRTPLSPSTLLLRPLPLFLPLPFLLPAPLSSSPPRVARQQRKVQGCQGKPNFRHCKKCIHCSSRSQVLHGIYL